MIRTIYSTLSTVELLNFAQNRDNRTEMETELAERLEIALMMQDEEAVDNDLVDSVLETAMTAPVGHG